MLIRTTSIVLISVLSSGNVLAKNQEAITGFALSDNGTSLISVQDITGSAAQTHHKLATQLDAIAYRPVTGELLGYSKEGIMYTIDTDTGALKNINTRFSQEAVMTAGAVAFDFNNVLDAARLVGADGENYVYFPDDLGDVPAGQVLRFTDVFYAENDINQGTEPLIYANAYTNAVYGNKAGSTFQYALDARTNALVSLANNAGTLSTINTVSIDGKPIDLVSAGGLEIVSPVEGENSAFAILQIKNESTSSIYSIDLETAEAELIADMGVIGVVGFAATTSTEQ